MSVGGRLMVSPNVDREVIDQRRVAWHGDHARRVHADRSPGGLCRGRLGAQILSGQHARSRGDQRHLARCLPKDVPVGAVGGVSNADFAAYAKVGIRTFGLGSSLYKDGMAADEVAHGASAAIAAFDALEESMT
jgi:2-dehydro-3-deoxyphosphogalactonate aldolase